MIKFIERDIQLLQLVNDFLKDIQVFKNVPEKQVVSFSESEIKPQLEFFLLKNLKHAQASSLFEPFFKEHRIIVNQSCWVSSQAHFKQCLFDFLVQLNRAV